MQQTYSDDSLCDSVQRSPNLNLFIRPNFISPPPKTLTSAAHTSNHRSQYFAIHANTSRSTSTLPHLNAFLIFQINLRRIYVRTFRSIKNNINNNFISTRQPFGNRQSKTKSDAWSSLGNQLVYSGGNYVKQFLLLVKKKNRNWLVKPVPSYFFVRFEFQFYYHRVWS